MEAGLESVRAVIGNPETSGLSDTTLRDVLWEYYFDIERTIQWAIGIYSTNLHIVQLVHDPQMNKNEDVAQKNVKVSNAPYIYLHHSLLRKNARTMSRVC